MPTIELHSHGYYLKAPMKPFHNFFYYTTDTGVEASECIKVFLGKSSILLLVFYLQSFVVRPEIIFLEIARCPS